MYIEKISFPKDLKDISKNELALLCDEIRTSLLKKLSEHGGHIGPNLGIVELTVAMHYVFNSPTDKFVFDVSHQSYVHKMLTGRKAAFLDAEKYDDVSGFSNPNESEHDFFTIGHTSTSVSLACGLAKARDLKGDNENIVAIIGDGSLSGGEAYEGLNNAVEAGTNLIVIVNDNEMSIAENYGGVYQNLKALRDTNGTCECNFFKAMGFEYHYVADGHDIQQVIDALNLVKDTAKPVVLHVRTVKGKGFLPAEENKELFHAGGPFDLITGTPKHTPNGEDYCDLTGAFLLEKIKEDSRLLAITSATPPVIGFTPERRAEAGKQFIDVGIAEEHAVAYASGIAKNGGKPVYGIYGTFIQRTYDQLSQDLCINKNPAVILVFWASVYGMNDITHLGLYDIPLMSNIPNLVYLAPTCKEEYFSMLTWAIEQNEHPVAIRVPGMGVTTSGKADNTDYSMLNRYQVTKKGTKVAVIALGSFYALGEDVVNTLSLNAGINATLINPKYITGVDEDLLNALKQDHSLVITLEDGVLDGGFGEKITRYYGMSDMKVKNYGIKKSFPDRYIAADLLKENGLASEQIVADIIDYLSSHTKLM
ncbi:MAG: 1-deoxy-D-xylulose-5-phosphate synthase [Muricomes sp.]